MGTRSHRIACGLSLGAALLPCGCSRNLAAIHESSAVRRRVRAIAGPNALNCGDNVFANLVPTNNACAIGAMTEHSAFYIVWNIPNGSATITRGIAMNKTGEMFMLSETHEPSPKFTTALCPTPKLVLDPTVTTADVLTCNP